MSLTEAITFLRAAADRTGSSVAQYVFHDGAAYARSPAILACHPVDLDGTFALPADDLDKALGRLGDDPTIEGAPGTMVLRKGRLRSSLTVLDADEPQRPITDVEWTTLPPTLMDALRAMVPFASKEGTWQRGVHFGDGRLAAINNRSAAECPVPQMATMDAVLSVDAADYLCGLPEPIGWIIASSSFTFGWGNGAWVRCQLQSARWPSVADNAIADAGDVVPVAITDEWREAIEHLAVLGDGAVRVTPDAVRGGRDHSSAVFEFATGAVRETVWATDPLRQMLAVATAWNPDADGAARWIGANGIRGIIMRRRS